MSRLNFKYLPFIILVSLISACVGVFFASDGQGLHEGGMEVFATTGISHPPQMGIVAGATLGFTIGLLYSIVLVIFRDRKENGWLIINIGIKLGIFAGIICAALVHAWFMKIYESNHMAPMYIGIFFGASAGAMMGGLSYGLLHVYRKVIESAEIGEQDEGVVDE